MRLWISSLVFLEWCYIWNSICFVNWKGKTVVGIICVLIIKIEMMFTSYLIMMKGTYLIFYTGSSDRNENFNMMMNNPEIQKMIMTTMQDSN